MSDRSTHWPARLRLDPSVFIAPGAVVVGEVSLGARASVWFNTVVRGDTAEVVVGEETNLQDNTTVHVDEGMPALIGARVTVGHRAIIHGCRIADDCLVGMGAVVLSGASIGAGSLIGAAALVREGQVIPPGRLALGAPARVVGEVSDAHRAAIASGAAHYVELSRSYLARGFARPHPFGRSDTGVAFAGHGATGFLEWGEWLGVLAAGPDWVTDRLRIHPPERWRAAPGPGRWSAIEVLCHLRDADREVYLPRVDRMLRTSPVDVADVDMSGWDRARGYAETSPPAALDAWRAARGELLARLAPLGRADWSRLAIHSVRGPFPLGEMVRSWVEHDLSHRRQIAVALGELTP